MKRGARYQLRSGLKSLTLTELAALAFSLLVAAGLAGQAAGPGALAKKGQQALEGGRAEEATRLLKRAVEARPGNPSYRVALAQGYLQLGRAEEALPHLQEAVTALPDNYDLRYALATLYQKVDNDVKALEALDYKQPPEPLRTPWVFARGFSLFRLGRTEEARRAFEKLLETGSARAPAHFFIANSLFTEGKYAEAIPHYETAVELGDQPDNKAWNAYVYNYGLALYETRDYRKAAEAFRKSIQRYSKDPAPWLLLGRCEAELGNFQEAIFALESAIETDPTFRPSYFHLARLHRQHGDKRRAKQLFEKIADLKKAEVQREERLAFELKIAGPSEGN